MFRHLLLFCTAILLFLPVSGAKLIDNPETVSYLHAEVIKEGSFTLESMGPGARVSSLEIRHSIPQETSRQERILKSVTGPDSHRFDEDYYGNEIIVLSWNNPPLDQNIGYMMVFDVEVWDRDDPAGGTSFPVTAMTEPDESITEKAYEFTRGLTTKEKFMELTSYVYDIVDYDSTYQNVQKSAKWVFDNQVAVCDGHANLLISMLRALGHNAYYVIGYAYTEENPVPEQQGYWGPHGWVEVEHEGKAFSLDPTWLEHPVDATHIKFALSPDSNYTEYVQIMANNVDLDWDKGDYVVNMIDFETEPRVSIYNRLLPEDPGSEEHSIMITDVSSLEEDCVLTNLEFQSCVSGGDGFLQSTPSEQRVGICDKKSLYWLLEVPDLRSGVEYLCSVSVFGGGAVTNKTVKAIEQEDHIDARISTRKVLTPNEFFRVNTTIRNTGLSSQDLELFLMLDESVQGHHMLIGSMQEADLVWTARAPLTPGEYMLRFFISSGDLLEEQITVNDYRKIRISSYHIPKNISLGESLRLNLTLLGLEDSSGTIRLMIDSEKQERDFILGKGEEKTFTFIHDPEKEGIKHINIVVLSEEDTYEAGLVKDIEFVMNKEWWESIIDAIRGLLESLFSALGMS